MRRRPASPLPQRLGLDPVRLRTPDDGRWSTMRDHLVERLPRVPAERVDEMLAERRVVDAEGPLGPDSPFRPGTYLWFHRDLPVEVPVPFGIGIVHRDDDLLVVDKPHFLATIPRGRHVAETALVRLRRDLDLPELSPAHRLDRVTAGLVMFVVRRERRGAYQTLFRDRRVHKVYEAVAPHDPELRLPLTVRSRIVKERGEVQAREVDGSPNAETLVERMAVRGDLARYRLTPRTGRTHQLRLHMSGLGVPILHDDFYPEVHEQALDDFSRPLQLLAAELAFTDPLSGRERRFTSRLRLRDLPDSAP
ncbi:RluA family pseudouridine synthase [Pseudonocardia sp. KRD-184]|uniref:RNA pseudouridylate synthase n=1 Tax=Pseudonocardia oceani TaxID=2792013 RepID=A0ABS6UJR6_9PSEU|nr:RluA family pseudouridine synthase [Pseudonocardia oceani]MBW0092696.1 RluA family pseudouridine synthase [Pseudonocardia oceani]MBW0098502.1 RluA family pseudouridine synthase [Pseudonocardia oceani]MBW0110980.1 RluA family pseudouridine synthase [Pseudonocardia oceani]MBW0124988.1 RluA family pseudouridine synthase [Pseudonocardia oceani]MBW0132422.1 RluA family pseudouridine synthase [Pseudonocardia oceani]